ncbi:hypothetical protein D1AOALGA4SA_2207 [Olavius algarvensis Delta 1 endosymbiont]|nr:hypothetical protein D1AOALGA4SA_2207 [Olavius algarvensis Delta 1 endosymbiont]
MERIGQNAEGPAVEEGEKIRKSEDRRVGKVLPSR